MDLGIGTELAGYRIERVIGRGGASIVYLAEHLRLGRKAALKVLAPHLAVDDGFRERFLRESRIVAGLDHPNVVPIFDAGEFEGTLYISMRYVEGTDLGGLLRAEGSLEPSRAIFILSQIAGALDGAHMQGLVHRDVKPGNILYRNRRSRVRSRLPIGFRYLQARDDRLGPDPHRAIRRHGRLRRSGADHERSRGRTGRRVLDRTARYSAVRF